MLSQYLNTKLCYLLRKCVYDHKAIFVGYTSEITFDNGKVS